MPIPNLTPGGLLPSGIHKCNLSEVKHSFVHNDRRRLIWDGFRMYLGQLRDFAEVKIIYVDGSFTTDKEQFYDQSKPVSDVDIVVEFSDFTEYWSARSRRADLFDHDYVKTTFYVDLWHWYPNFKNDLREFFQTLRVEDATNRSLPAHTRKGLLKVDLEEERKNGQI